MYLAQGTKAAGTSATGAAADEAGKAREASSGERSRERCRAGSVGATKETEQKEGVGGEGKGRVLLGVLPRK